MVYAKGNFQQIWIVDASTLEALFRKLKSLETSSLGKLGGRICPKGYRFAYAVVDLTTRYPIQTWFNEHPYAHESNFVANLLELVTPQTLLILDRGFWNYGLFEQLTKKQSNSHMALDSSRSFQTRYPGLGSRRPQC